MEIAAFLLEKTRLVAPFGGILSRIDVELDEYVQPGRFLFSLMDVHEVKIESFVREDVARALKPGQELTIRSGAREVAARVRSVAPGTDNESRTFKVILTATNREDGAGLLLRPGTTVRWAAPEEPR